MNHVDHHTSTHRNTDKRVHLHRIAIGLIQLLKVLLQINNVHLSGLGETIKLKPKRTQNSHVLGAILQSRHASHEPLGELLDGRVHVLLTLDELELKLHLLQRRVHREPLTHRDTHLGQTLKLAKKLVLFLHQRLLRHTLHRSRRGIRISIEIGNTTNLNGTRLLEGRNQLRCRRRGRGVIKRNGRKVNSLKLGDSGNLGIHEQVYVTYAHYFLTRTCFLKLERMGPRFLKALRLRRYVLRPPLGMTGH